MDIEIMNQDSYITSISDLKLEYGIESFSTDDFLRIVNENNMNSLDFLLENSYLLK